jgi:hypothetical protein
MNFFIVNSCCCGGEGGWLHRNSVPRLLRQAKWWLNAPLIGGFVQRSIACQPHRIAAMVAWAARVEPQPTRRLYETAVLATCGTNCDRVYQGPALVQLSPLRQLSVSSGWAADAYIRPETYNATQGKIIDAHHRLPVAGCCGDGTTPSSARQFFRSGKRGDAAGE